MAYYVAGAIVVSAVVGAYSSNKASKQAAAGSVEAARIQAEQQGKGLEWQKEAYGKIEPYLLKSLGDYQNLLDNPEAYKQTPGYMFRLQEGLKAAGIPTGGKYLSGSQIKGATQYAENYATTDYQNALARVAGLGEVASGVGATTLGFGTNIANIYNKQGEALGQGAQNAAYLRASGTLGVGNAISSGLGQYAAYKNAQQYQQPNSYYGAGMTSGYGSNVSGDAYAPAYGGGA
jgi:hypothetical protein